MEIGCTELATSGHQREGGTGMLGVGRGWSQGMRTLGRDKDAQEGQGRCSGKDMNPGDRNSWVR